MLRGKPKRAGTFYDGRASAGAVRYGPDNLDELLRTGDWRLENFTSRGAPPESIGRLRVVRRQPLANEAREAELVRCETDPDFFREALRTAGLEILLTPAGFTYTVRRRLSGPERDRLQRRRFEEGS
jgi:hypothetical protein